MYSVNNQLKLVIHIVHIKGNPNGRQESLSAEIKKSPSDYKTREAGRLLNLNNVFFLQMSFRMNVAIEPNYGGKQ